MSESSRTVEILIHILHKLAEEHGLDLRQVELVIQSDSCSREGKNFSVVRIAAVLVLIHKLSRVELRYLASRHSHEDVDAFFGVLAGYIEQHNEVWTPEAFMDLLNKFLSQPAQI